jgi:hypothetical protein
MRNVRTYEPMVENLISTMLERNMHCRQSWPAGVWMFDAKRKECLFYGVPKKENARSGNSGPFKTKNKKHDTKVAKNILIHMVHTTATHVLVSWTTPEVKGNQHLEVSRPAFEQWLYETCRLDWCLHEITEQADDKDTTMSVDNYWLYGDYGVQYADLVTYIVENRLALLKCA